MGGNQFQRLRAWLVVLYDMVNNRAYLARCCKKTIKLKSKIDDACGIDQVGNKMDIVEGSSFVA